MAVVWRVLTTEDTESTEVERGWGFFRSGQVVGTNHNRKGKAFEIEQPKVGPKGEASGVSESKDMEWMRRLCTMF